MFQPLILAIRNLIEVIVVDAPIHTRYIDRINNSNLDVQKFCLFCCASCVYFFFNFFESDQKSEKN
jgi:hypothetical protein